MISWCVSYFLFLIYPDNYYDSFPFLQKIQSKGCFLKFTYLNRVYKFTKEQDKLFSIFDKQTNSVHQNTGLKIRTSFS